MAKLIRAAVARAMRDLELLWRPDKKTAPLTAGDSVAAPTSTAASTTVEHTPSAGDVKRQGRP